MTASELAEAFAETNTRITALLDLAVQQDAQILELERRLADAEAWIEELGGDMLERTA